MIIRRSFEEYKGNFVVALAFGLPLFFVILFSFVSGVFASSGSMFLEYDLGNLLNPVTLAIWLVLFCAFLALHSLFVAVMVFAVRRDLSKIRPSFSISENARMFALRIFSFNLAMSLGVIAFLLLCNGLSVHVLVSNLLVFLALAPFLFLPQAIVVEELPLKQAIPEALDFAWKNKRFVLLVLVIGALLLAAIILLEFFLDTFFLWLAAGRYVSMLLVFIFLLPYLECLKTYLFMFKYDLIKKSEQRA